MTCGGRGLVRRTLDFRLNPGLRMARDVRRMGEAYRHGDKLAYLSMHDAIYRRYGCCIAPSARIGVDVAFPHPVGIVIGEGTVIGAGCTVYQGVTVGRSDKDVAEYPVIGNDCVLYAKSSLVGAVHLGSRSVVAAHAVVLEGEYMDGSVLAGVPAHVVKNRAGGGLHELLPLRSHGESAGARAAILRAA